jgi:hypothetical protein
MQKATELKNEIDSWYDEIITEKNNRRNFPSYIGTPHENPVLLNRNDAKGTPVAWSSANDLNYWEVKSLEDGVYDIRFHFIEPVAEPGMIFLKMYPHHFMEECRGNMSEWTFKNVEIKKGEYKLEPYYLTRRRDYIFPFYVSVERIDN